MRYRRGRRSFSRRRGGRVRARRMRRGRGTRVGARRIGFRM